MRSDGVVFESVEIDNIFKFIKQISLDGVPYDDAIYPKRLWKIHDI